MRNKTVEGKVTVFKALVVSKIVHLVLVTNTLVIVIEELIYQKKYIEILRITWCNNLKLDGLKYVHVSLKIKSFKFS